VTAAALLALALTGVAAAPAAAIPQPPAVLAPSTNPFGLTYGQWSAKWWKYVLEQDVSHNPILDDVGFDCGRGQSGPVFYLVGLIQPGSVTRSCFVPGGKALFIPVRNVVNDNTVPITPPPGPQQPQTTKSYQTLLAECAGVIDTAADLTVTVDYIPVPGVTRDGVYRTSAPSFSYTPPTHSITQEVFGYYAPGGVPISPVAADGVYVMLAPLSPGAHLVRFKGTIFSDPGTLIDVTYQLIVRS
jgi:hypothetical protein